MQIAFRQQQFAQARGRVGRAEEHAVGHDDAGPATGREVVDEPFEEQQFGGAGVQLVVEVGKNAFVLHPAGERRIGEDDVESLTRICAARSPS